MTLIRIELPGYMVELERDDAVALRDALDAQLKDRPVVPKFQCACVRCSQVRTATRHAEQLQALGMSSPSKT